MCGKRFALILSALLLLSLSLSAQSTPLPVAPVQSSMQTSQAPEQVWQMLHERTPSLLESYDQYQADLSAKVNSLTARNQASMDYALTLEKDNSSLKILVASLQEKVGTSENSSSIIQTDLNNSTSSTIKAQSDATGLELQVASLKIGCVTLSIVVVGAGVYEGGRLLKWWK